MRFISSIWSRTAAGFGDGLFDCGRDVVGVHDDHAVFVSLGSSDNLNQTRR